MQINAFVMSVIVPEVIYRVAYVVPLFLGAHLRTCARLPRTLHAPPAACRLPSRRAGAKKWPAQIVPVLFVPGGGRMFRCGAHSDDYVFAWGRQSLSAAGNSIA